MRSALLLFGLQFGVSALVALYTCAVAGRDYPLVAVTGCLLSLSSWIAVTEIVKPGWKIPRIVGYVLGSTIGDLVGVWIAGVL